MDTTSARLSCRVGGACADLYLQRLHQALVALLGRRRQHRVRFAKPAGPPMDLARLHALASTDFPQTTDVDGALRGVAVRCSRDLVKSASVDLARDALDPIRIPVLAQFRGPYSRDAAIPLVHIQSGVATRTAVYA